MAEQTCKDCRGTGEQLVGCTGTMPRFSGTCPTCDGTGTIHRTGPYRLADGTWSDGIDRTHTIPSHEFSNANPERVYVHGTWDRDDFGRWKSVFDVWHGDTCIKTGWPFAEAIAYADHHARTTKNGDNK